MMKLKMKVEPVINS